MSFLAECDYDCIAPVQQGACVADDKIQFRGSGLFYILVGFGFIQDLIWKGQGEILIKSHTLKQ